MTNEPPEVEQQSAFARFWAADAVSSLGTAVSTLALQLLLIRSLHATPTDLGFVLGAQWLPYLIVGLPAGALVDRLRRRPVLVAMDVVSALLLGVVAVLALRAQLTVPILAGLVFCVGVASTFYSAAQQSYLPRIVATHYLTTANSRVEQTWASAQSFGPLLAGTLVRFVSAPWAVLVDAASYLVSAATLAGIRTPEPPPAPVSERHLGRELAEGARWVYHHPVLTRYALSLHLSFLVNSIIATVLVFYATVDLGLDAFTVGLVLAAAGLSGIVGAGLAPRLAERFGLGRVCVASRWIDPVAYGAIALCALGAPPVPTLLVAQLLAGFSLGLYGPLHMTYRNVVTPDRLRARMNATIRAVNWGSIAFSAPLGGWLAVRFGTPAAICVGAVGALAAAAVLTFSPYRHAVLPDDAHPPVDAEPQA